jgi:hypothetical protein
VVIQNYARQALKVRQMPRTMSCLLDHPAVLTEVALESMLLSMRGATPR